MSVENNNELFESIIFTLVYRHFAEDFPMFKKQLKNIANYR